MPEAQALSRSLSSAAPSTLSIDSITAQSHQRPLSQSQSQSQSQSHPQSQSHSHSHSHSQSESQSQSPSQTPTSPLFAASGDVPPVLRRPSTNLFEGRRQRSRDASRRPSTSHSGYSATAKKATVSSGISKRIEALKLKSSITNAGSSTAHNTISLGLGGGAQANAAVFERMRKRTSDNVSARLSTGGRSRPGSPNAEFLATQRRLSSLPAERLRGSRQFVPQRMTLDSRSVTAPLSSPLEGYILPDSRPVSRTRTVNGSSSSTRAPSVASTSLRSPQLDPVTGALRNSGTESSIMTDTSNSLDEEMEECAADDNDRITAALQGQLTEGVGKPMDTPLPPPEPMPAPVSAPTPALASAPAPAPAPASRPRTDTGPPPLSKRNSVVRGLHLRRGSVASIVSAWNLPSPTRSEATRHSPPNSRPSTGSRGSRTAGLPSPTTAGFPPLAQDPPAQPSLPSAPVAPAATPPDVVIGEVSVHFPGTLLWKRRVLRLDHEGNLVLTAVSTSGYKAPTRTYHITQLKTPRLPEVDEEELPHSIILSSNASHDVLQIALETRQGQQRAHENSAVDSVNGNRKVLSNILGAQ
ncbi:hypothetical protein KEM52_006227 [Ascosphaera acerosa]|nr:hypothetical protein KEM52_006227 [Ascosphaera acerosa]